MKETEIPRRADILRNTSAERTIRDAMTVVEELGAHPLLTDTVALLDEAFNKLADWTDSQPTPADKTAEDLLQKVSDILPWRRPWKAEDVAQALPHLEELTRLCREWE